MLHRLEPRAWICATAALFLSVAATAQQQTAAGAQQFLAALAKEGALFVEAPDKVTGKMTVQGSKTYVNRWLQDGVVQSTGPYADSTEPSTLQLKYMLNIVRIDGVGQQGNVDDCTTRIDTATQEKPGGVESRDGTAMKETFFGYDELPYRVTITSRYEDPAVKYAGPYYIAWNKATVARAGSGRITARVPGARFDTQLAYQHDDPDMADRVEFAMKFLKASCDKTAATGF
jgi:hypothetical protein